MNDFCYSLYFPFCFLFFGLRLFSFLRFLAPLLSCYRRRHWFSGKSKTLQLTRTKVLFLFLFFFSFLFSHWDFGILVSWFSGVGLVALFAGKVRVRLFGIGLNDTEMEWIGLHCN